MVSDNRQGLTNVEANVTVRVRRISPHEARRTTPLTVAASTVRLLRPPSEVRHVVRPTDTHTSLHVVSFVTYPQLFIEHTSFHL